MPPLPRLAPLPPISSSSWFKEKSVERFVLLAEILAHNLALDVDSECHGFGRDSSVHVGKLQEFESVPR
jgi:hypothetical protein